MPPYADTDQKRVRLIVALNALAADCSPCSKPSTKRSLIAFDTSTTCGSVRPTSLRPTETSSRPKVCATRLPVTLPSSPSAAVIAPCWPTLLLVGAVAEQQPRQFSFSVTFGSDTSLTVSDWIVPVTCTPASTSWLRRIARMLTPGFDTGPLNVKKPFSTASLRPNDVYVDPSVTRTLPTARSGTPGALITVIVPRSRDPRRDP